MDEDLERLLPLLGDYLCNRPRAITAQDMATLTADGLPAEEAWRLLLAALSEEDLRRVLALVPDCSLVRFDCGHAIHIEEPKAFVSALLTMA